MAVQNVGRQGFITKSALPALTRGRFLPGPSAALLLNGNGASGSTTIVDSGANAFSLTTTGTSPTINTTTKKYGTGSIQFTNGRIVLPTNTALDFGTGAFTIEFWMYAGSSQQTYAIITDASSNNSATSIGVGINNGGTAGKLTFNVQGGSKPLISTTTVTNSTWHHIACVRNGTNAFLFVNGALEASRTDIGAATTAYLSGGRIGGSTFGTAVGGDNVYAGYLDDFRIVKGSAVYSSAFTAPQTELANGGQVNQATTTYGVFTLV